ncbi:MAG: DUF7370 family protein [Marinomonas gallaica]
MAATITTAEIIAAYPAASSVPDFVLQAYIDQMDSADACLDGLTLTDDQEKAVKLMGVLHIMELSARGGVQSEGTKAGASRSYFAADSINSTSYGKALQSMSGAECILAKVGSDSRVFVGSVKGLS